MGHHKLREDKECQNCGYTVDKAYCSQCGQQNTETRQSFIHLATHVVEDITHYDGNFWKTIKYLLFRPGKLTIEYLLGHRMRYVPPVKLYIFISFVCFFMMALMAPDVEEEENDHAKTTIKKPVAKKTDHIVTADSTRIITGSDFFKKENLEDEEDVEGSLIDTVDVDGVKLISVRQLDSLQDSRPSDKKLPLWEYYQHKMTLKSNDKELTVRDFIIAISHTLPKVLFIYMPIFAFWLWLVHGKKRWYFFDHSIFTLHYFSFLLLIITINMALSWLADLSENGVLSIITEIIKGIIGTASLLYPIFYFFRSHRRFYGESKAISRAKSFLLFIINFILIMAMSICTLMYIALNTH